MRTDSRSNGGNGNEDVLQLQNPMKISMDRPAYSRDNNERREPRSANRSGTAASGGARIFRSRDGTMDRPPARTYDRREGQARGSPRISSGSSDEPALILDNPMKVGNTLHISLISTHGKHYNINKPLVLRSIFLFELLSLVPNVH